MEEPERVCTLGRGVDPRTSREVIVLRGPEGVGREVVYSDDMARVPHARELWRSGVADPSCERDRQALAPVQRDRFTNRIHGRYEGC